MKIQNILIETLETQAEDRGLQCLQFSAIHHRITDGSIMFDLWPTTGTYRAFRNNRSLVCNGRARSEEELLWAIEDAWPTMLK